jgi:hypothetical protein
MLRLPTSASLILLSLSCFAACPLAAEDLPSAWQSSWETPPAGDRPLQIVHGIPAARASVEGMQYYRDRGLGGIVCNVAFDQYLRSEAHWQTLEKGIAACRELGLIVWLYDEDGYPSGAAGGLVLAQDSQFEAAELAYDAARDEPFVVRRAYEHTHAANNYYAARRYANLIDDRAARCFVEVTHEAYRRRLESYFGETIQAMFTDEPSLIAVNLGQIPEPARSRVRVADPLDPNVPALPSVPWCYDLPDRYRERYGQDLMPQRRSLFVGAADADRQVRRQFWQLIAELTADRYFGAIQKWCQSHRVASSGHTLHEESLLHHVPLEGNALQALAQMDIPGLDMLTSDPAAVIHSGWLTAALPSSAAQLNGSRRVMTEVSDFSQKMSGGGPASLPDMQATAAWQAAWGVTEFTLYYGTEDRPAETCRAYGDYVGRLNTVLKPARFDRRVLLYYPIYDLWSEYLPVSGPLRLESQTPRARQIVASFMQLGRTLQRSQIPFVLADHEHLAQARIEGDRLRLGDGEFESLIVPQGVELPPDATAVVERFQQSGGRVLRDQASAPLPSKDGLIEALKPAFRLAPASDTIALGRFVRDGRSVLLLVNVGSAAYAGQLVAKEPCSWLRLDPASGDVQNPGQQPATQHEIRLEGRQALLLVAMP